MGRTISVGGTPFRDALFFSFDGGFLGTQRKSRVEVDKEVFLSLFFVEGEVGWLIWVHSEAEVQEA